MSSWARRKTYHASAPQVVVQSPQRGRYDDPARIKRDTTRGHALNWFMGISILVLGFYLNTPYSLKLEL